MVQKTLSLFFWRLFSLFLRNLKGDEVTWPPPCHALCIHNYLFLFMPHPPGLLTLLVSQQSRRMGHGESAVQEDGAWIEISNHVYEGHDQRVQGEGSVQNLDSGLYYHSALWVFKCFCRQYLKIRHESYIAEHTDTRTRSSWIPTQHWSFSQLLLLSRKV